MSVYTVSALTDIVRQTLAGALPFVWVQGEVSNFSRSQAGHIYFALKDERAQLDCVWFAGKQPKNGQKFDPLTGEVYENPPRPISESMRNGVELQCAGAVDVYAQRGKYQLIIETVQFSGTGLLARQFEERKAKLASLGYFSMERKRPLPANPLRIALITSQHGAALHDFLELAKNRGLGSTIRLLPVQVQGTEAAEKMAAAIEFANASDWAQVIVLIRGGGSLEDLWAFNEEILAEAVFNSRLPVLAGIGHEIDFTLADLTADIRAATPSHAAQLLWSPRNELWQNLDNLEFGLDKCTQSIIDKKRSAWQALASSLKLLSPDQRLRTNIERLKWLEEQLIKIGERIIALHGERLASLSSRLLSSEKSLLMHCENKLRIGEAALGALDPGAPLRRGYALLFDGNHLLASQRDAAPGQDITAILRDGSLELEVVGKQNSADFTALLQEILEKGNKDL